MSHKTPMIVAAIFCLPAQAIAQQCAADPSSTACFNYKYKQASETVAIRMDNPFTCDDETWRAVDDWNAAIPYFAMRKASSLVYNDITRNPDAQWKVSFESKYNMINGVNHPAESDYKVANARYTVVNGTSYWIAEDGDVRINRAYWDGGKFLCDGATPNALAGEVDFTEIMAEELGHSLGLGHVSINGCVMRSPTVSGTDYDGLCSQEVNATRSMYVTSGPIYTVP